MKTALVIMAAGIGSRFGGGIKQLAAVGPNGEIIMDYSIHDAIEAGFDKIVFIIRHDIEEAFKEAIGDRIEKICAGLGVEIDYAFQALENVPEGFSVPEGRSKPWGTGQAVLACKGIIKEPFAVINADDYYGKEAFVRLHDFLQGYTPDKPGDLAMAGFVLKNTLSDNGAVTRGICQMNDAHYLTGVLETGGIEKTAGGAAAGGKAGSGVRDEEHDDNDRAQRVEQVALVMESQRQELRHRDGVQIGRVPPQPPGHDQPVQPCAHRKADGRPAGRGDAGQVREAGHPHQQPAGHIAGLGAHGRDQRAHLAAAKVEVGAVVVGFAVRKPDEQHCHQIDNDGNNDTDVAHILSPFPYKVALILPH